MVIVILDVLLVCCNVLLRLRCHLTVPFSLLHRLLLCLLDFPRSTVSGFLESPSLTGREWACKCHWSSRSYSDEATHVDYWELIYLGDQLIDREYKLWLVLPVVAASMILLPCDRVGGIVKSKLLLNIGIIDKVARKQTAATRDPGCEVIVTCSRRGAELRLCPYILVIRLRKMVQSCRQQCKHKSFVGCETLIHYSLPKTILARGIKLNDAQASKLTYLVHSSQVQTSYLLQVAWSCFSRPSAVLVVPVVLVVCEPSRDDFSCC